jgi:protein-tyrosine phosphatase
VQLTRNLEGGRRKADEYFPGEVGKSIVVTPDDERQGIPLKVTLCGQRTIECARCIESTVSILPMVNPSRQDNGSTSSGVDSSGANLSAEKDQMVTFKHLLYLSWPDHGIPEDNQTILSFIQLVAQTNRNNSDASPGQESQEIDPDPPIMVGCSAGIGRTGSFIAISSLLRSYGFLPPAMRPTQSSVLSSSPLGPIPEQLQVDEVAQEIDSLREQRPGMVQRPEQVILVYRLLAGAFGLVGSLWKF